ncbi:MAG TPA: aspartyl protease family protein [Candidatus Polarisedimenticolaceae bacterium]|nr:aspartyl protease family protein [Candidatus Polarisedimenticolaceae bacterium]
MLLALGLGLLAATSAPAPEAAPAAVKVPMTLSFGRPTIELKLNDQGPYRFLFDTGSGAGLIIDEDLANALSLAPSGTRRIGDPNTPEAIEAKLLNVDRVQCGELTLRSVETISWKRDILGPEAPRGVVGLGLFAPRPVTIDGDGGSITIEPAPLPEPDGKTVLKASFDDGIPSVPIDVAGTPFKAHLDSGSTGFIGLPLSAADKLPLDGPPHQVGRARTASGDYPVLEAGLNGTVRIGSLTLDKPKIRFVDLPQANIGGDLLRSLVVTVDRAHERVRLVSNGKPMAPTERPRLGIMTHGVAEGKLPVEKVVPGSPAEAAGVKEGDQITKLNGRPVGELSFSEIGQLFQFRPLVISVIRDGAPVDVTVGGSAK